LNLHLPQALEKRRFEYCCYHKSVGLSYSLVVASFICEGFTGMRVHNKYSYTRWSWVLPPYLNLWHIFQEYIQNFIKFTYLVKHLEAQLKLKITKY